MTAKVRVLTVIDELSAHGGAERLAVEIVTRLDPSRFEPILCVTRRTDGPGQEGLVADLQAAGVALLQLGRTSVRDLRAWAPVVRLLRRRGADVVHSHKFGSNLWAAGLSVVAPDPVYVAHEHTWSFEGHRLRRLLDRQLISRRVDLMLAVSNEDRRRMIEVEGIDPEAVRVLPNGIAPSVPAGHDVRGELGIGADQPVIGAVCMLRPQKAIDVLLRAAARLRQEFPALVVLVAGEGPERQSLEALTRELGLAETVRFLGPRADVADVLAALDVAVSSSDFEGSSLAIMEYMEAAKAIVATAVGGTPDLIEPGVHGLLVRPRDPESLAEAVAGLLRDASLREELGRAAAERRRREFDIDVMARTLETLYVELLGRRARRSARA